MSESRKGGRPKKTPASATKKTRARAAGTVFEKLSAIALPDTVLTMTWGSPHSRVAEKTFCG